MTEMFSIGFDQPWFLLLLAIVLIVWWVSFKGLANLGRARWLFVNLLRSVVIVLVIFALSEIQIKRTTDRVAVIYVLDQSESVPLPKRRAMRQYVVQSVAEHRERDDLAGVVVFGRTPKVDHPPIDEDLVAVGESDVPWKDATNIAAALKLAKALFTDETAKRIVLVTDGNENVQDAMQVAQGLAEDGVGIDVVPVMLASRSEVAVEKVTIPADLRKGQTFQPRVVINNYGVLIILFGIIIKVVLYPLTQKSFKSMAAMKELQPKMRALGPERRLPTLEMALPSLAALGRSQAQEFSRRVQHLIELDGRVTLYEFALGQIIKRYLARRFQEKEPPLLSAVGPVSVEFCQLRSAMVYASTNDDGIAAERFEAAARQAPGFRGEARLVPLAELGAAHLSKALEDLARTRFNIRRQVIAALAHAALADGEISAHEGDLLRAVAISLECPLPPTLGLDAQAAEAGA